MKTSLLTIALAVATMPMMFAKSQVPPPANTGSTAKPAVTTTSKKHTKKSSQESDAQDQRHSGGRCQARHPGGSGEVTTNLLTRETEAPPVLQEGSAGPLAFWAAPVF